MNDAFGRDLLVLGMIWQISFQNLRLSLGLVCGGLHGSFESSTSDHINGDLIVSSYLAIIIQG